MAKDQKLQLDRRGLLLGSGAALAGGMMAATTPAVAKSARSWDRETDIIAIGGGAAGLTAAVTAAADGADVVVLEALPMVGGTTAKSGGVFWIPNNYTLREKGIEDKKEDCMRYMCRFSYPELYHPDQPFFGLAEPDYRRLEAFYDHGSPMADHLRSLGALKMREWRMWTIDVSAPDYQSEMPENKVPTGRPLVAALDDGSTGQGSDLTSQLEAWLLARGVPVLTNHRVAKLIQEDGRVIGVEATHKGETVAIKARRGVIFGTGGYAHNPHLIRRHQPAFIHGSCAQAGARGDFVTLGASVGAQLGNMGNAWRTSCVLEQALRNRILGWATFFVPGDSMFFVNKFGQRVVNEKRNYNDRTEVQLAFNANTADYPNLLLFMIYDQRTADLLAGQFPYPKSGEEHYVIKADDWDSLAEKIDARLASHAKDIGGIRLAPDFGENLKTTAKRFNGFAKKGVDEDFKRGGFDYDRVWERAFAIKNTDTSWSAADAEPNNTMHALQKKGPYYAIIMGHGALDTNGGPVINEHAQVLDYQDQPIPGLFGAGNCIANPSRHAYFGAGGTIGPAMTFGYIAAKTALAETS
ncbi:MAG: FAD-dependent oxidoreductase [Sphingomonadales bacterium]